MKNEERRIFYKAWKQAISGTETCLTCVKPMEANKEMIFCKLNQRRNPTPSQGRSSQAVPLGPGEGRRKD